MIISWAYLYSSYAKGTLKQMAFSLFELMQMI